MNIPGFRELKALCMTELGTLALSGMAAELVRRILLLWAGQVTLSEAETN